MQSSPCRFMMEYDVHTVLDFLTLLAIGLVICMLWFPLRSLESCQVSEDSLQFYFVVRAQSNSLSSCAWNTHHASTAQ